jgi:hypothetical protein
MNLRLITSIVWLTLAPFALLADTDASLRERYPGPDGRPSEAAYLQAEGIAPAPGSETYTWQVVFKLTYPSQDLPRLETANPVATDCSLIRTRTFTAPYRAVPVWDGRVYVKDGDLVVGAYTDDGERLAGRVGEDGIALDSGLSADVAPLLRWPDLRYNPFTGQVWRREPGGEIVAEQEFYLPFAQLDRQGRRVGCAFEIARQQGARFALVARSGEARTILATCDAAQALISKIQGYSPKLGPGCVMAVSEPTTVIEVRGEFAPNALDTTGRSLVLTAGMPEGEPPKTAVRIDGNFGDWRNVSGITDARDDIPGYLQYNPDTDLLEFKVANDATHLYVYTRVAGRHGNTVSDEDRYYFYAYIDADRNRDTGYIPTRDDNCYWGVDIGDDCEAQYEFIGGRFVKTFFGFTGAGTEKEVLAGRVTLGQSWYSRYDEQGQLRHRYKVEYVKRGRTLHTTADYTEGTSDDIVIAISPDGSECEMGVELAGFLRDQSGKPIIAPGQRIDIAVGVEASGLARGNTQWGADSTPVMHGYLIAP